MPYHAGLHSPEVGPGARCSESPESMRAALRSAFFPEQGLERRCGSIGTSAHQSDGRFIPHHPIRIGEGFDQRRNRFLGGDLSQHQGRRPTNLWIRIAECPAMAGKRESRS